MNTKKYISNAFIELTKEKHFEKITIKDITERAQVSRSTFYNHFADKYEVVEWYLTNNSQLILKTVDAESDWYDIFFQLNLFVENNKFFYKTMYLKDSSQLYRSHFVKTTYQFLKQYCFSLDPEQEIPPRQHLEILFLAEGIQRTLHEWIVKNLPLTAAEITDIGYQMVPSYIRNKLNG